MADVRIESLTAVQWPALEKLFREGGDPRWCWCMYWRMRAKDFSAARVPELRERLRALASSDLPPGLVAFAEDGRAVGWVSLAPREDYERLERSRTIPRVDDEPVWSVVCFAVARHARGEGVGRVLLDGAVDWARERGVRTLEAYPVDVAADDGLQPAAAFTGTLAMFERAGFHRAGETTSRAGGFPRVVVRRAL